MDRVLEKQCRDSEGKILSKVAYSYDADGNISAIHRNINGNEATETFAYDSFKRQTEAVDALGNKIRTLYDENCVNIIGQKVLRIATIDPKNKSVIKTEDPYGRVVQEDVLSPERKLISTQEMTYDPNGNLLRKKNLVFEKGHYQRTLETAYTYTPCNQVANLTRAANSSNSRTTLYSYTPGGKIASRIKPDGTVISYHYHPLGHLKSVSADELQLSYAYNLLGDLIQAKDETNNIWVKREIDPHGNILSERFSTGLAIEKTYDALNRPLSIELPGHGQILYTYDPLFLRSVSRISPTNAILYTHRYTDYDSYGFLHEERLIGNLGTLHHAYDTKGRKTSVKSPFHQECYSYDETDNVIAIAKNGTTTRYAYDELDQLTKEAEETYSYDTNSNRIEENGVVWTTNEFDELLSTGKAECTYDLNGNLLTKKTPSDSFFFSYDSLDRLTNIVTNSTKSEMAYGPLGRRLTKTVQEKSSSSKTTEYYLYDGDNDIGAFTEEGSPLQLRTLGLAYHKNTPSTVAIELKGQIFAPIQDLQGNIISLISPPSGKKMAEYNFNAFGKETTISETIFNPYRYASKRFDPETNLINFGKRTYDADLCRWLTTDPAGFIDGMNLYSYVKNNPYRYNDPNGLFAIPLVFIPSIVEISFAWAVSWITAEAVVATVVGTAIGVGVYQLDKALDNDDHDITMNNEAVIEEAETERKKKKPVSNTNPFSGPIDGDVVVIDDKGNAIKVPPGNWLTGSRDGKWIQEMQPGIKPEGQPTGTRKDGGHPVGPKHSDPRAWEPHGHVPGVSNSDGTPWLPINT